MTGEGRHPDQVPMRDAALSLPMKAVGQPIQTLEPLVPVRVWIPRARHGWVQLEGTANAYTAKAVHVEYVEEHGRTGHAWVWAGCVQRV